jgi:hypothetical protein
LEAAGIEPAAPPLQLVALHLHPSQAQPLLDGHHTPEGEAAAGTRGQLHPNRSAGAPQQVLQVIGEPHVDVNGLVLGDELAH